MGFDSNYFGGLVNQGKVRQIMEYLSQLPEEAEFLNDYVRIYEKEDYPPLGEEEGLKEILLCYQKYYREVFYLEQPEPECRERLRLRLLEQFPDAPRELNIYELEDGPLQDLLAQKGLFIKTGAIGGYMSPFIWKKSEPKTYQVELPEGVQECTFLFAEDFIFLGWWWYVSLGLHKAGAWVGDDGIITCDWRSYDLQSEDFNISMLKHEAQHVMDLRRWPDISSEGLEYRAYLTELIYYETENRLIHFDNSASPDDPGNEYACAAYYVCNDFYGHFQTDDFAAIPIPEIQEYAKELLRRSTQQCLEAFPEST